MNELISTCIALLAAAFRGRRRSTTPSLRYSLLPSSALPKSTRYRVLNERGDTLVEVTMALAILALVLTSAFAIANKAYRLGQDAYPAP